MKIAFADRAAATGDPAFVDVPVARLIAKDYAAARRAGIDMGKAGAYTAGPPWAPAPPHTTHVTVADADGNVVAATQTINSLFGSQRDRARHRDAAQQHHGAVRPASRARAVRRARQAHDAARCRRPSCCATADPVFALGLPGGVRIFTSVLQAIVNLIDHGMSLQEAVEAPRVWTQGQDLEVETAVPGRRRAGLAARGHRVVPVPPVGGGMGAIAFEPTAR